MSSDHYDDGDWHYVTKLTDIFPSEMPLLLPQDDFHTYMVKLTTIGPFQNYQVQTLCVDTDAWDYLGMIYTSAVEMLRWIERFDEAEGKKGEGHGRAEVKVEGEVKVKAEDRKAEVGEDREVVLPQPDSLQNLLLGRVRGAALGIRDWVIPPTTALTPVSSPPLPSPPPPPPAAPIDTKKESVMTTESGAQLLKRVLAPRESLNSLRAFCAKGDEYEREWRAALIAAVWVPTEHLVDEVVKRDGSWTIKRKLVNRRDFR